MTQTWIALTRPGFEELLARETAVGRVKPRPGAGWATIECETDDEDKPWRTLNPHRLIFARTLFLSFAEVELNPAETLARRVADAALAWRKTERLAPGFHSLVLETPDDEEGRKTLTRLAGLDEDVADELHRAGLVPKRRSGLPRLHLFFPGGSTARLGLSDPVTGSPWPMGAPKFELPEDAPSRSARKVEEAIQLFMTPHELEGRMMAGMRAVDLGAAPGGWSYMLSRRGLIVAAVDNGDLAASVFDLGLVTHHRADGYTFRPPRPVDWLFCDMVGGALRIARLVGNWLKRGDFREAIFNLKLGAGDKLRQINEARTLLLGVARDSGARISLEIKHLYHDREEVTAHLVVLERDAEKARKIAHARTLAKEGETAPGKAGTEPRARGRREGAPKKPGTGAQPRGSGRGKAATTEKRGPKGSKPAGKPAQGKPTSRKSPTGKPVGGKPVAGKPKPKPTPTPRPGRGNARRGGQRSVK